MQDTLVLDKDFERLAVELEQVEAQICTEQDEVKILRMQIDEGLDEAMKGLEELKAKLPKEQSAALFDQCTQNALNAVVGHFGLASAVLGAKDGGNVDTTHNVRQGIYASEEEKQRYENRGEYNPNEYHQDKEYIRINKEQGELKAKGELKDYMTGKKINPNDKTDLDHIVSAKTIHDDRARVLAEEDGTKLANTESNLKMTDSSLNRAKKDKSAEEFLNKRDERLSELAKNKEKRGYLTESEQNEMKKLQKQQEIKDEDFKEQYDKSKETMDKIVDKKYYTSAKPYKQALLTGAQDATKMAVHSVIGAIFVEFIQGMSIEIKILFKEFGNESLKDIFKRFETRIKKIYEDIKVRWKEILKGSLESAIVSFFSNFVTFIINVIFTTLKNIVRIIRAGFTSLYQAVKTLVNPPKDMPKEDVMFEASKIFVTGLISSLTMLGAETIKAWLLTIPGLNVILMLPIPFSSETIGDALSLCIAAAGGAILSTIAIYYMDKYANKEKEGRLQVQIMAQSGVIVQYNIAQTWFSLYDAYDYFGRAVQESIKTLQESDRRIMQSSQKAQEAVNNASKATDELEAFMQTKYHN